jgi:murein L,D-transpeptidase YafK
MLKYGSCIKLPVQSALRYSIFLSILLSCNAQEKKQENDKLTLSEILENNDFSKKKLYVLIDKSDYKLYICIDSLIIKEYPVVFGKNTTCDKLMEGDHCTPEGKFTMISKYPHKSWSKFIWLNYPNEESWKKHTEAKKTGKIPANAKIGGEIGIHGVPDGMDFMIDAKYNWTLGCISMKNKDINELYPYITKTTIIEIRK